MPPRRLVPAAAYTAATTATCSVVEVGRLELHVPIFYLRDQEPIGSLSCSFELRLVTAAVRGSPVGCGPSTDQQSAAPSDVDGQALA